MGGGEVVFRPFFGTDAACGRETYTFFRRSVSVSEGCLLAMPDTGTFFGIAVGPVRLRKRKGRPGGGVGKRGIRGRAAGRGPDTGGQARGKEAGPVAERRNGGLQLLCISKMRPPHGPDSAPCYVAHGGAEHRVFGEAGREKDVFLSVKKSPSRFLFIFSRKERRGKEKRKAAFRRFFCARTRGRKQKKEPFQYDMP